MDWLNYHHLLYFHTIAREGSIAQASKVLRLAQATISGQLKLLEEQLGVSLFDRKARGLALTDVGRKVFRYADEIFSIGKELQNSIRGGKSDTGWNLRVGVVDVVPKLISYRLIEPALLLPEPVRVVCNEGKHDDLLEQLSRNRIDLVISDTPSSRAGELKVFNHLLGETTVSVFGAPQLAADFRKGFPATLNGAPILLPMRGSVLRGLLDAYFDKHQITSNVVAEFEDSALAKVFGQSGHGLFFAPSAIESEIKRTFEVELVGRLESIRERFFVISVDRRLKNPAIAAITEAARNDLFKRG
ncbi:MAG: LysR family transcriptional regulator [Deltaproteobacteria bacterium]|nr:LysR family transcriptional regulator [Deltaproteobacteria bacterium]